MSLRDIEISDGTNGIVNFDIGYLLHFKLAIFLLLTNPMESSAICKIFLNRPNNVMQRI